MGSVKLNIYKVELLDDEIHSVVEFASAISLEEDVLHGDSDNYHSDNDCDSYDLIDFHNVNGNSHSEYDQDRNSDGGQDDAEKKNGDFNNGVSSSFIKRKKVCWGTKKRSRIRRRPTTKCRLKGEDGEFLKFRPNGFLRPMVKLDLCPDEPNNEFCNIVSNLNEFIYFREDPAAIAKLLRMSLLKSGREYDLRLEIVHKDYSSLKFLKNKMFKRWFFNIDDQAQRLLNYLKNRESEKDWALKSEECKEREFHIPRLKLFQSVYVMRRMIEGQFVKQELKIWNSSRSCATPLWYRMKYFLLKSLFLKCAKYISHRERLYVFSRKGNSNARKSKYVDLMLPSNRKNAFGRGVLIEEKFSEIHTKEFKEILKLLPSLKDISEEEFENSQCSVTHESSLPDIFDKSVINLLRLGKVAFLSCISVTGIPVRINYHNFSPDKDLWTFRATLDDDKNIFSLVNKNILDFRPNNSFFKDVFRGLDDKGKDFINLGTSIKFNAVIPIFEPEVVSKLEFVIKTKAFNSLFTYCIMRNPRVICPGLHFVSLLWLWIRLVTKENAQMEFCQKRLKSVCATAKVYADSDSEYKDYKTLLFKSPNSALRKMVEHGNDEDVRVKSENLVKPLFFAYIYRDEIDDAKMSEIFKLVIREFIGRAMSHILKWNCFSKEVLIKLFLRLRENENSVYTTCLCEEIRNIVQTLANSILEKFMKESYVHYDIDERNVEKKIEILKMYCTESFLPNLKIDFIIGRCIQVDRKLLFTVKDKENIGDFNMNDLYLMALEQFRFPKKDVLQIFDSRNLFRYVYYNLKNNDNEFPWKRRLEEDAMTYEEAHTEVTLEIKGQIQELVRLQVLKNFKNLSSTQGK